MKGSLIFSCFTPVGDATTSPVVAKLRSMIKNKKSKTSSATSTSIKGKTVRIYAGWKHEESNGLRQVVASRGGGSHPLDLPKEATDVCILKRMTDTFFPGGRNEAKGVDLTMVSTQLATFSGQCLWFQQGTLIHSWGYPARAKYPPCEALLRDKMEDWGNQFFHIVNNMLVF